MDHAQTVLDLMAALEDVVVWADKAIPAPEGGFSNADLATAEAAISHAYAVLDNVSRRFRVEVAS